jgi:hypothetical protein
MGKVLKELQRTLLSVSVRAGRLLSEHQESNLIPNSSGEQPEAQSSDLSEVTWLLYASLKFTC